MSKKQSVDAFGTDHLQVDLKGRSVRGGLTSVSSQASQFVLQTLATVVLARLLTPVDFGLVAMVTAVTALATGFADLGLSEATIQREKINHQQVSTLFWINVVIGFVLMLVTIGLAPVLAWIYHEPRVTNITIALSLLFAINGLRVQPEALLKRQMRFTSLAIRDIASLTVSVTVSIFMARHGGRYWALVMLPVLGSFLQMIFSWFMAGWIPGMPHRDSHIGSMISFGSKVATSYFIVNLNRSADNVLVGWYWGAAPLGLYSRAFNLLMLPVKQLNAPVGAVAIPTLSRIQDDPERYARYYLRAINLIMWISVPVFAFLFVAAGPVIALVLGPQWRQAAPVFQFLTISAVGQVLLDWTIWLLVSRGESGQLLKLSLIISPIIVGSFVVGLPFGINGVALSGSLILLIIMPFVLKFAFRGTHLTLFGLGHALMRPLLLGLVGLACAEIALHVVMPRHTGSQLFTIGLGFLVVYLSSTLIPSVRGELASLRKLSSDLRPTNQTA